MDNSMSLVQARTRQSDFESKYYKNADAVVEMKKMKPGNKF